MILENRVMEIVFPVLEISAPGHLGGSVRWASDFGSGHDVMVMRLRPTIGLCADSMEPAWDSLSPLPLSARPPFVLSLKINKH